MTEVWSWLPSAIGLLIGVWLIVDRRRYARDVIGFWMGRSWMGRTQYPDPMKRGDYERRLRQFALLVGLFFIVSGLYRLLRTFLG
jgi:hypothetical protein